MALKTFVNHSLALSVTDRSEVGDARRQIAALTKRLGWPEPVRAKLGLLVNEAGANMVRHAQQGQMIVRVLQPAEGVGIELLALDRGPGMASVEQCMRDGFSTAGSAGTGLGALRRLSDAFDIYSEPGVGTGLLMRLWVERAATPPVLRTGAICVPRWGESACGDAWALRQVGGRLDLLVVDGLGHGPAAAGAADEAVAFFESTTLAVPDLLPRLDERLRRTRGAAVAICEVDVQHQAAEFWSVGNVAGVLVHGRTQKHLVGQHGTAGIRMPQLRAVREPMRLNATIIMHSDGLAGSWRDAAGDGSLLRHDPSLIAGVLYRDHGRERDDVTVVVARLAKKPDL